MLNQFSLNIKKITVVRQPFCLDEGYVVYHTQMYNAFQGNLNWFFR